MSLLSFCLITLFWSIRGVYVDVIPWGYSWKIDCNVMETPLINLKRHLLCDYDPDVRPETNHKNVTAIDFALAPKYTEYDSYSNILNLHTWTVLSWYDRHLIWTPSEHDDVKFLHLTSQDVWTPDLSVHHAAAEESDSRMTFTSCWVGYDGNVRCVPEMVYSIQCILDHEQWPYDVTACKFEIASWTYSRNEISLNVISDGFMLSDYTENHEWALRSVMSTTEIHPFKFNETVEAEVLMITLVFQRHGSSFSAIYVTPIIVLMLVTLVTLWLDPKSNERMILANTNFILHLLCVTSIHWALPPTGSTTPSLMLFYQGSIVLAAVTLIFTSILRYIQELESEAPEWITTKANFIVKSKIGQFLLLSILDPKTSAGLEAAADDNDNLMQTSRKQSSTWQYVALFLSWIAFSVVLLTYFILLGMFLPTDSLNKFNESSKRLIGS